VSGGRCPDRQGRRFAALPRTSAPWLLVTLSLFLISSWSNNSRSAPSATATTTTATVRDPPLRSTTVATARLRTALAPVSALTALGDSVPYGTACNCTPYPQLTAADVASITRHAVKGFNDAVPGYLSSDVLRQLQSNPSAIADVQKADAVMIEVGANDIAFSSTCGTNISCYESRLPQVTTNITAIVSRVRQLTAGRHITIVLLDYWSVWLGGRYAQAQGPAYVDAASSLTHAFSGAIHSIALTTGSIYVDLRTAFRGPDDDRDETNLLASDGDHPDAEGHERIADAILQTLATI
jgi:acyl-CoA thioesterase I